MFLHTYHMHYSADVHQTLSPFPPLPSPHGLNKMILLILLQHCRVQFYLFLLSGGQKCQGGRGVGVDDRWQWRHVSRELRTLHKQLQELFLPISKLSQFEFLC